MMADPDIEVRTYFARKKNALVARADFSELYAAWYLHRMDCSLAVPPACDQGARDALAALTLHCAGRPHKESCAWTIHITSPRMNLFAAGDNNSGPYKQIVTAAGEGCKASLAAYDYLRKLNHE